MTFIQYILERINLSKHYIYNYAIIEIDSTKIIFNIVMAILILILLKIIVEIKKAKQTTKSQFITFSCLNLILLIYLYTGNYSLNGSTIIFCILVVIYMMFFIKKEIKIETIKEDEIILYITFIMSIFIIQPITALLLTPKSTILINSITPKNNIYFAKEKNNSAELFDKIVIYQTKEYSILCDYTIDTEEQIIKTNCNNYEITNNTDILFKRYEK